MRKSIEIKSDPENLHIVEKLIDEMTEKHQIESDLYGKMLVATIEAVNNAIIHGNKSDSSKKVCIDIDTEEGEVKIRIRDEGEGFDYKKVPDPTAPENIENIHGRGVFLMTRLSDGIKFNETGTEVEMTFKI
jgi:serine/threonine-protein kinase RsbW